MKFVFIIVLFIVLGSPLACAGPLEEGKGAYDQHDYKTALRELRPLAEQGDAAAQFMLGDIYDGGQYGVDENLSEAVKWFRLSAEQGNPEAADRLATRYDVGNGVRLDTEEAKKWYRVAAKGWRKLADNGDVRAQVGLADLYEFGNGVERDFAEVYFWYSIAAMDKSSSIYALEDPAQAAANAAKGLTAHQKAVEDQRIKQWTKIHRTAGASSK
jgi:TPR repeat protein